MDGSSSTVVTSGGMETIIAGIGDVTDLVGEVFTVITGNPLLTFFLAVSVLGVGFRVFRQARRTAH